MKEKKINLFEWMIITRPNQSCLSLAERANLRKIRDEVFASAGIHKKSIDVAKYRGSIGKRLYDSVYRATQSLEPKYQITVPFEEYQQ